MNIGKERRIIEVEPVTSPLPEVLPMPVPEKEPELEPAEPGS